MKKRLLSLILLGCLSNLSYGQEKHWAKPDSLHKSIQPFAILQMWTTYTLHERQQLTPEGPLETVQDRLNFTARRARLGFRGKPYKHLSYYLALFYDNLGRDRFSGTRAGVNDGQIGVWDAYLTWRISARTDLAHLTFGYFRPQLSRECITAAFAVNSFEKSSSQTYIRQHLMGRNHGRTMGINLGGQRTAGKFGNGIGINYNIGLFNNNTTASDPQKLTETTGKFWSPLLVGRVAFTLGDPEMKNYGISYDINYFNERKGVTVALNASHEGKTDIYNTNRTIGADVLINYAGLNLDGEWVTLQRRIEGKAFRAHTGHARAGYNVLLKKKYFLEPSFMLVAYQGDNGGQFSGRDLIYDAGLNWYLNKKSFKLYLHYVWQNGEGNNGYTNGTSFEKGNYLGAGFNLFL